MQQTWRKEGKPKENEEQKEEFNTSRKLEMEKLETIWKRKENVAHSKKKKKKKIFSVWSL